VVLLNYQLEARVKGLGQVKTQAVVQAGKA
jgi:hypothetical protein